MAVLLPGGTAAAAGERVYEAHFNAPCVVGPGILNIKSTLAISTKAVGPISVEPGQEVTFKETSSTIRTPVELTESFVFLGATEVRGSVLNFVAESPLTEPTSINIAKPATFPEGLPYVAPVEKEKEEVFNAPSENRTFSFALKATGKTGETINLTLNTAAGYTEVEAGEYKATGNGIVSTASGYNAEGKKSHRAVESCLHGAGRSVAWDRPDRQQRS
jgi:hypothetical protein